ncbi:PREDICTED: uncharacterized protein LOC105364713 [Ceratosolen solmsi marchali]|uniref:Uncharacterized protein LOC105364713 n=1 Tax=Ceratosolen solmsi marchali TaxID=326594 RepID=A0AAJ6YN07_9HYME|nr:PREDICTED: uncharacterized protein LOC105364713 [Ceratosolen solmsi marchali]
MADNASRSINFFITGYILLSCPLLFTAAHYQNLQPHYQPWYRPRLLPLPPRRAIDLMSDIINELGIRILQQYLDNGNVAFSPAGVGFIMAALYEGSSSRSRQQIIDSLGMPRDKNAVRVGMRDIHRRLRTYLNPDGFLGGLNLNRENTSLRGEYEDILRFYGFDLSVDLSDFDANSTSNFGLKGSSTSTMSPTTTPDTQTTSLPPESTIFPTDAPIAKTNQPGTTTSPSVVTMLPNTDTSTTMGTTTGTVMSSSVSQSDEAEGAATTLPVTTSTTTQATTTEAALPTTTMAPDVALISTTTSPLNLAEATTLVVEDIATVAAPTAIPSAPVRRRSADRRRRSSDAYFTAIPDDGLWMQDLDIWADQVSLPENSHDVVDLQFLVNGCEVANVPASSYTAVLPFAYFPSLKAAVLEFPLDNPRYNVMLFLPTERVDTGRLARELSGHSLRLLRRRLQGTWVHATIPSFMLRGFVTLTPYLQRLGIKDVFEPRLADLSPMTPDLGVYARDVQQSIAVNIRNYMKEDAGGNGTQTSNGDPLLGKPQLILPPRRDDYRFQRPVFILADGLLDRVGFVSFSVDHPFLYFIIDDETSASLIAGRIDDPLNSRIL